MGLYSRMIIPKWQSPSTPLKLDSVCTRSLRGAPIRDRSLSPPTPPYSKKLPDWFVCAARSGRDASRVRCPVLVGHAILGGPGPGFPRRCRISWPCLTPSPYPIPHSASASPSGPPSGLPSGPQSHPQFKINAGATVKEHLKNSLASDKQILEVLKGLRDHKKEAEGGGLGKGMKKTKRGKGKSVDPKVLAKGAKLTMSTFKVGKIGKRGRLTRSSKNPNTRRKVQQAGRSR